MMVEIDGLECILLEGIQSIRKRGFREFGRFDREIRLDKIGCHFDY